MDNYEPDWQQQHDCERQRWETLIAALDAAVDGKATPEQMKFIARECGVTDYKPRGHQHAAHE